MNLKRNSVKSDASYLASLLASVDGPVVLVGHSYGGNVISNIPTTGTNVKALVFVAAGPVDWTLVAVVAAGALLGGALGGRLARHVSAATLRWSIVVLGVVVAAAYFAT